MDEKSFASIPEVVGRSLHRVSDFKDLDLSFRAVGANRPAEMHPLRSLLCACNDTAHQCI